MLVAVAVAAGGSMEPDAQAQVPPATEQIIVTGERVNRSVRKTPSSVAVFGASDLDRMAAPDRIQNVLAAVPNVLVPTSRDAPVIRGQVGVGVLQGLPAFLGGARPRTVMQVDGRTVTFNEFVNSTEGLWDVARIEVFRSPQTTTQGVNSIAGAIFVRTAEPTYEFEERAQLVGGTWRRRQASATLSGPILDDQLAFRVSGDIYRAHTSTTMHGPVAGIDNLNLDRYWTARAKLLIEPRAIDGLKVLTTYAHTAAQAPQGEAARPPYRKRRDDQYVFGYFKSGVDSVTSLISYRFGPTLDWRTTLSLGKSHFRRFAPQGYGQTNIRAHDGSAESVLEWTPGTWVTAVAGASFQQVKLDQFIDLSVTPLGTGSFKDRQRSAGLFGDLSWHPAERVTVAAGARYQLDGKERTGVLQASPQLRLAYDRTSRAFLPKASVAYDLTDRTTIGAMVQRAYNPGGVTLDPAHHKQLDFAAEYMWSYEAFVRGELPGAAFTANLFYNDMRNAQRELDFDLSSPGGQVGLLQIISEPRARSYGAEVEVEARLSGRFGMQAAVGLLRTRITEGVAPNDPFLGKEFAGAPRFTGVAAIDWQPVRSVRVSAQVRHNAGYWGEDSNDPLFRTTGWSTVDARVSWDSGRVTVFGYAQNLFDTLHILGYAGPRDDLEAEVALNDPREIGVGLRLRL